MAFLPGPSSFTVASYPGPSSWTVASPPGPSSVSCFISVASTLCTSHVLISHYTLCNIVLTHYNDIHTVVVNCQATMIECKMIFKARAFSQIMVARHFIAFLERYKNICKISKGEKKH